MKFLLDTDTCVFILREHAPTLRLLADRGPGACAVSVITVAELWFGARRSNSPARSRAVADAFLAPLSLLDFGRDAAERYAALRHALEASGRRIGEADMLIAATALVYDLTVVTHNVRDFARVPGLEVQDWSA